MKFLVLLLPVLLLLGDTILDHTTILCNGAEANVGSNPPKQGDVKRRSDEDGDEGKFTSCMWPFYEAKIPNSESYDSKSQTTPVSSQHYIGSQVPSDGYDFGSKEPPDSYDARKTYRYCESISNIINQSRCGSCWAITVAAVFSDRLCIQSGGKVNHIMSAIHLVSCSKENYGCRGGRVFKAWKYIEEYGLVTGGGYGSNEGCQPYPFSPLSLNLFLKTPKCIEEPCPISYKAKDIRLLQERNEYEIRREIYNYGPVTAQIDVYKSFEKYKGGIYRKTESPKKKPLGMHSVRIIGWGEEDNQKYWIADNSRGEDWGEGGFVKIPRGENYCGIEFFVTCATPVL